MLINYRVGGPLDGGYKTGAIDSQTLTPEEAVTLFDLIDSAKFFSLPLRIDSNKPEPVGHRTCKVTIEFAGEQHTVNVCTILPEAIPESLKPLLHRLGLTKSHIK